MNLNSYEDTAVCLRSLESMTYSNAEVIVSEAPVRERRPGRVDLRVGGRHLVVRPQGDRRAASERGHEIELVVGLEEHRRAARHVDGDRPVQEAHVGTVSVGGLEVADAAAVEPALEDHTP